MGWIILSILIILGAFIGLGFKEEEYKVTDRYGNNNSQFRVKWKFRSKQWLSLLGFIIILPSLITTIPANSVGIVYSPFSGVSQTTLTEGIHTKNPFSKVYKINTEVQTLKLEKVYTQTSDSQFITSKLDIKYAVNSSNAFLVFKQFRTLDRMSEALISPTVQRTMELVTTQYNVIDILGSKRTVVYEELQKALKDELAKYGITFYSVTLEDTNGGENIEKAIEKEAVARKAVETAEQELLKAQTEAKQKTVVAQAEQDAAKIKSETLIIEAKAEKDANELLTKSLTEQVLYKMYLDKWNGKLSTVVSGDNGLMFDINSFKGE